MDNPETIKSLISAGTTALLVKDLAPKVLGPTASYLGDELKSWTQQRIENTKKIFEKAIEIRSDKNDNEGSVNPLVLKEVIYEGSFNEDNLACEYFGGVLASSKVCSDRDDRGACLLKLVSAMTVYQLRAHYIFYKVISSLYASGDADFTTNESRRLLHTHIQYEAFLESMDFSDSEDPEVFIPHIMAGLKRLSLIADYFHGSEDFLRSTSRCGGINGSGIVFEPTVLGAELFLSAHGVSDAHINKIFNPELSIKEKKEISIPDLAHTMKVR